MTRFDDDYERGCLESGEPLEAFWGAGWWSERDDEPQQGQWFGAPCEDCGEDAWWWGDSPDRCEQVECPRCDWII
jgi:hypothetical protein